MLREAQRVIGCGDAKFSAPFRLWLLRALAIRRRKDRPRDTTLVQYRTALKRRLDRIMACSVPQARAESCAGASAAAGSPRRCSSPTAMPPTKNVSERALRPSLVFRKVTNGFRSEWGAETYAAFRSVVATARIRGNIVLTAVQQALHSNPSAHQGEQLPKSDDFFAKYTFKIFPKNKRFMHKVGNPRVDFFVRFHPPIN